MDLDHAARVAYARLASGLGTPAPFVGRARFLPSEMAGTDGHLVDLRVALHPHIVEQPFIVMVPDHWLQGERDTPDYPGDAVFAACLYWALSGCP